MNPRPVRYEAGARQQWHARRIPTKPEDPRADTLRAGYATVARAYADELSSELDRKPLDRAMLIAFAERAPAGLVLDVGCGPGHVGAFVATHGRTVEGVDLSPAMVEVARARHPGMRFREGDMFALPYADASVAGIVAFYAIVHMESGDLPRMFAELHRVLVPGGVVMCSFHVGTQTVHVDELFGCATSLDFMFHDPALVVGALETAGLTLEARLDRKPYPGVEHPSERTYLVASRPAVA